MGRRTTNFEEIKSRLIKTPVFHLPKSKGRFNLYSDTNKFAMDSAISNSE